MNERCSQIIYSSSIVFKIREKDPNLDEILNFWKESFGTDIEYRIEDGRLIIQQKNETLNPRQKFAECLRAVTEWWIETERKRREKK